jgi:hypothetical protein
MGLKNFGIGKTVVIFDVASKRPQESLQFPTPKIF